MGWCEAGGGYFFGPRFSSIGRVRRNAQTAGVEQFVHGRCVETNSFLRGLI